MADIAHNTRRPAPRSLTGYAIAAALPLAAAALFYISPYVPYPEMAKPLENSTVLIESEMQGTAFHIGNGTFLTNRHVVGDDIKASLTTQSGIKLEATVLWTNEAIDVALLNAGDGAGLETANLSCRHPVTGEPISVEGHPRGQTFVTTWGKIAGKERPFFIWEAIVPTDLTIVGGQSGAAVKDASGNVIGIASGYLKADALSASGISFIIPSSTICQLLGRAS